MAVDLDAGPARAALRHRDLWRRRLDPRTHPRHGRADRSRDLADPGGAPDLRRRQRDEVDDIARSYWDAGVRHIVALRGDPPEPGRALRAHPGGYANAAELVAGLKKVAPFDISVAAYPEMPSGGRSSRQRPRQSSSARSTPAPTARSPNSSSPPTASSASATRSRRRASTSRSCRASCRSPTSRRRRKFAGSAARRSPTGWTILFEGLDDLPAARQLVAATVAAELCGQLYAGGVRHFHFYTLNRAELTYAICHLLGVRAQVSAADTFRADAAKRILVKDGAYGTMIQAGNWSSGLLRRGSTWSRTRRATTTCST